jgi:predicted nucleotidyltransferase
MYAKMSQITNGSYLKNNNSLRTSVRYKNIRLIKEEFSQYYPGKIKSAIIYGSVLSKDFNLDSDYDILLIASNIDTKFINNVRVLKNHLQKKLGIRIDINLQSVDEMPKFRGRAFWHNNRGFLIQKEMLKYGYCIIGKNPFGKSLNKNDIRLECVRLLDSYVYQTRKILINKRINYYNKMNIIKFCIYATYVSIAFIGRLPKTKETNFELFKRYFKGFGDPSKFLYIKKNLIDISNNDINDAYKFLSGLDNELFLRLKK